MSQNVISLKDALCFIVDNRGKTVPTAETGMKLIATNCISNDNLYPSYINPRYVSDETYRNWFRAHPEPGDIILTNKGSKNGAICLVPDEVDFCIAQDMMALRADPEKIDPLYLFAALRSEQVQADIKNLNVDGVIPHFKKTDFKNLFIPLPERSEQVQIGLMHYALCKKIEVNRKTVATLEEMARALYRSWFVDFDPVHAKAAGRTPAHMDAQTAALFPDSFGENGLPKGWELGSVSDVFDVIMGQSPPGSTYNENGEGLPFFQGRTDFGFRFPTRRKFCTAPTRIAPRDSILLSVRAPVGDLNRAWEECCIGRGVASLSEKAKRNAYGYEALFALSEELKSYDSEGTVFGAINKKQLAGLEIINPTELLKEAFEKEVGAIDAKIRNITEESRTLIALRDTLLPRLMSGELRVGEAKEQVEAVA